MEIIEKHAIGREKYLMDSYISRGPVALMCELGVSGDEWRLIFDHLVFEYNLLFKIVLNNSDFFLDQYVKNGISVVREILDVHEEKYDRIWEPVFDFLAIANSGLVLHVLKHRERYSSAMQLRGANFVRKVLGLWNTKYNDTWRGVLDLLLISVCDNVFTERTFEQGLSVFNRIFNSSRTHRTVVETGIF